MSNTSERAKVINRVFFDPIQPALVAGSVTGVCGLGLGAVAGVLQNTAPFLFSAVAGLQCFSIGASFWYTRSALIQGLAKEEPSPSQKLKYSAAAGTFTGAFNGALRSRSNVVPGMIMFTSFGFIGQAGVNFMNSRRAKNVETRRKPLLQRVMESKWMPLQPISDEDYLRMLEKRALSIDAEIAVLEDKIQSLSAKDP